MYLQVALWGTLLQFLPQYVFTSFAMTCMQDRHILVSNDPADRRIGAPEGLQQAIDVLVAQAGEQVQACRY